MNNQVKIVIVFLFSSQLQTIPDRYIPCDIANTYTYCESIDPETLSKAVIYDIQITLTQDHQKNLMEQMTLAAESNDFETIQKIFLNLAKKAHDPEKQNLYSQKATFYEHVKFSIGTIKQIKFDDLSDNLQKYIINRAQELKQERNESKKEYLNAKQQFNDLFESGDIITEHQAQQISHKFHQAKANYDKARMKFDELAHKIPNSVRQENSIERDS